MLIDWFTVAAQVLNFIVLVGLMKRFLYGPVLAAIDAREQRIAAELADAASKKSEADRQRVEFQQKNQVFDQQRAALLQQATDEAGAERHRLLAAAASAADAATAQRQQALLGEAAALHVAVGRRAQQEVFAIARQTLADLAAASLEAGICDVFIRRLRALDEPARATLAEAIRTATDPAQLRSAFALPQAQRDALQQAVDETFAAKVPLRFTTASELVAGIDFCVNGQSLEWSIAKHLDSLEKSVGAVLKMPAPFAAEPVSATVTGPVGEPVAAAG